MWPEVVGSGVDVILSERGKESSTSVNTLDNLFAETVRDEWILESIFTHLIST